MKTHDFSVRSWGNNYTIMSDDGNQISLMGWSYGINDGDYLILQNGNSTTRYQVTRIKYLRDPKDMFEATATFAPRT